MQTSFRILTVAAFSVALASTARAQDEGGYETPAASSDSATIGLLFGFGFLGLNTPSYDTGPGGGPTLLGGGASGGIGAKYLLMPQLGIRGMLNFGSASADHPANPGPGDTGIDGSQSARSFGAGVGVEYYLATGRVRPYVGATVRFVDTATESKSTEEFDPANPDDQVTVDNDGNCETIGGAGYCAGSELGVAGIVGFEFFPWPNLSLAAEYQLGYARVSRKTQSTSVANVTVKDKIGSESNLGVASRGLLTLGIYF